MSEFLKELHERAKAAEKDKYDQTVHQLTSSSKYFSMPREGLTKHQSTQEKQSISLYALGSTKDAENMYHDPFKH